MEIVVKTSKGEETGRSINLNDSIFGIEPNDHAIYLDIKLYLANQRQGTHKAKERSEVSGSTKKIKKQKGTGTARAGSIKSPVFRGGGRVFGPRPRGYSFKLNKKLRKLARMSAFAYKAKDNNITVVDSLQLEAPKTKDFVSLLNSLSVHEGKSLIIVDERNQNLKLSSRNLKNSSVVAVEDVNTFDILNAKHLVISEGAIGKIENLFISKTTEE